MCSSLASGKYQMRELRLLEECAISRPRLLDAIAAATPRGLDASLYGSSSLVSLHEQQQQQHTGWIQRWLGGKGI